MLSGFGLRPSAGNLVPTAWGYAVRFRVAAFRPQQRRHSIWVSYTVQGCDRPSIISSPKHRDTLYDIGLLPCVHIIVAASYGYVVRFKDMAFRLQPRRRSIGKQHRDMLNALELRSAANKLVSGAYLYAIRFKAVASPQPRPHSIGIHYGLPSTTCLHIMGVCCTI